MNPGDSPDPCAHERILYIAGRRKCLDCDALVDCNSDADDKVSPFRRSQLEHVAKVRRILRKGVDR